MGCTYGSFRQKIEEQTPATWNSEGRDDGGGAEEAGQHIACLWSGLIGDLEFNQAPGRLSYEHPKTDEFYVSVFQLSTFFQLEDGVQYAIAELERKGDNFDPALQFQLARMFRVDDWIEPAFCRLMKLPDSSIQLRQLGQIGDIGCYHLIRTKDQIRKLRARLAFGTPALRPFKDCNTPGTCNWSWRREWWAGFARLIHHPDVHLPFSAIPDKLYEVQMAGIDGVCDDCLRSTINSILEDGKFGKEEEFYFARVLITTDFARNFGLADFARNFEPTHCAFAGSAEFPQCLVLGNAFPATFVGKIKYLT
ncbi:hypothetical protein C8R44DRAFT_747827 [Mycena epipterygia]|nr:hypothetical protein C8R44DRAFT_747827 [Mycena epipterygia]